MFSVRRATIQDISLIQTLANRAFTATYRELLSKEQVTYMLEWMYSSESLQRQFEAGHVYFIGAYKAQDCAYAAIDQEMTDTFHLQKIYVLPEYQGSGLGAFLFRYVVGYIRTVHREACRMLLNVNRDNAKAIAFYKYMGMSQVGEGDFPIGEGFFMTDYIMALDLA